jgi:RecB family exonuclease
VYAAVARLATCGTATGRICFSYSSRDTREYRETFPSWLMLQAYRLRTGEPSCSYPQLRAALGAPVSGVPSSGRESTSDAGWWLAQLKAGGFTHEEGVLRGFPNLGAGRRADAARASTAFTEFDGDVPDAGAALDPSGADYAVSATQLEDAAECPFRHFLRRGLGLQAVEDDERDRDVWLDPLTRGAELHDLYAEFLRRCRSEERPADLAKDREWLREAGRRHLATLRHEMPPPSDEVYSRESDDLLRDLDLFLEEECKAAFGRTSVGFEVSFGREPDDDEELARADPVEIPIGGGRALRLGGRIDRIDRTAEGTFEIIDYKTGGFFEADWAGTFAGGTRLQHALYGIAAVELLKRKYGRATVEGGVYYFSSTRGRQERVRIPRPSPAAMQAVLSDLRDVIAGGTFIHAPGEDACKWCDFGAACGPRVHEHASAKLGDPRLRAYIRLRTHE